MYAEMKWKTIAVSSLQGNTNEMLPEYERLYTKHLAKTLIIIAIVVKPQYNAPVIDFISSKKNV